MTNESKLLCIYHNNCADGFGSAWIVRDALGEKNVEFFAANYQEEPPEVEGRDVLIVDFSYKKSVMEKMARAAESITVLDHHASAEKELLPLLEQGVIKGRFDMSLSGVGLTWGHFFGHKPMPLLLRNIQDRDLWRFELDYTSEVTAALFSYPYDFAVWDRLSVQWDKLVEEGAAILRKRGQDVKNIIENGSFYIGLIGYEVPAVNAPKIFASDVCHQMAYGHPFAVCFFLTNDSVEFSLRSTKEGIDVSEVAQKFGGGGHKHAAGFRLSRRDAFNILVLGERKEATQC